MKVIISHDVDHLYPSDHCKDLIFPKFWVRSFIELIKGNISVGTFCYRLVCVFFKRMNRIPELCEFDKKNSVHATYFFGMANALGMSYKKEKALPWIEYVKEHGYDAGVHGCDYQNMEKIQNEHDDFYKLTGINKYGIRNHYVRYDDDTFNKMNKAGYIFDTSEFNKHHPEYKDPYKVGTMWEFPLALMDGYIIKTDLERTKVEVSKFIDKTMAEGGKYLTILFHDSYFDEKCYPREYHFYIWLISHIQSLGLDFISYKDAISELE